MCDNCDINSHYQLSNLKHSHHPTRPEQRERPQCVVPCGDSDELVRALAPRTFIADLPRPVIEFLCVNEEAHLVVLGLCRRVLEAELQRRREARRGANESVDMGGLRAQQHLGGQGQLRAL